MISDLTNIMGVNTNMCKTCTHTLNGEHDAQDTLIKRILGKSKNISLPRDHVKHTHVMACLRIGRSPTTFTVAIKILDERQLEIEKSI
jgi:hypothetical protein